jgi:hypothetical protein
MCHILRRNCLLKYVTERRIEGTIKVTGIRGRRHKQLLSDLTKKRGYCTLAEEALDSTLWRTRSLRGRGPVAGQTTERTTHYTACHKSQVYILNIEC